MVGCVLLLACVMFPVEVVRSTSSLLETGKTGLKSLLWIGQRPLKPRRTRFSRGKAEGIKGATSSPDGCTCDDEVPGESEEDPPEDPEAEGDIDSGRWRLWG